MTKKIALQLVETVINSCHEAITGEWDCSTPEGEEGFKDMIQLLYGIKKFIEEVKK